MAIQLKVNGKDHSVDVDPTTPLLWVIREQVGLTGTKYGCGIAQCGGRGRSRQGGGQSKDGGDEGGHALFGGRAAWWVDRGAQSWIDHQVPQCGFCQSGMLMAATDLLAKKPKPTDADIDAAMTNICRCGSFQEVRAAIHSVAKA